MAAKPKKEQQDKITPTTAGTTQDVAKRSAAIRAFLVANRGKLSNGRKEKLLNESKANRMRLRDDSLKAKNDWEAKQYAPAKPTTPAATTPTTPTTPSSSTSGGAAPTPVSPWAKAEKIYSTGKWVTDTANSLGNRLYRDKRGVLWRVWQSGRRERVSG